MNELALEEKANIKDKIYEINGKYVMLIVIWANYMNVQMGQKI